MATTIKELEKLENDRTVIVKPDEKNRQIHHLHINDKFKAIAKQLDKITKIIDLMDEPIKRTIKILPPIAKNVEELLQRLETVNIGQKPTIGGDLYDHFLYPYEEAVIMMLRRLFVQISNAPMSEIDANALRTKILRLLNRVSTQIFDVNREKDYLDFTILELKTFQLSSTKEFAEKNGVDITLRQNIIHIIQDFEKDFLI